MSKYCTDMPTRLLFPSLHFQMPEHLAHIQRKLRQSRIQLLDHGHVWVNGILNHLTVRTSLTRNIQKLYTARWDVVERSAKNSNFNPDHAVIEKHRESICVSPSCYQYSGYTGEDRQQSCVFCKYAYNLLWGTQFTWVVNACFIASQIDV